MGEDSALTSLDLSRAQLKAARDAFLQFGRECEEASKPRRRICFSSPELRPLLEGCLGHFLARIAIR